MPSIYEMRFVMSTSSLDSTQYHLLKTIRKNGSVKINTLSSFQLSDCEYLLQHGYIEAIKERVKCDTFHGTRSIPKITAYQITPSGRAAIYDFKSAFYKWWIPVIISIVAIVISLTALLFDIL